MCTWIDRSDIDGTAGLKEDCIAGIAQSGHEREALRLVKRFPSRDLHEATPIGVHLLQDLIDRALLPSVKGIVGIAPGAAERASGQPYKHTGLSGVARLTLNAMEDLGNSHTTLVAQRLKVERLKVKGRTSQT
jgi:hypothetical protein